jgi:protein-S-isoprenylcysteine O-methyltransferase Ste14
MKTPSQKYPLRSWILVAIQLACLVYLLWFHPWKAVRIDLQIWELSGIFIAISGLIGLGWFSFSVFPEPRTKARFVRSGIFAFIRHPMYAGVLTTTATLVWQFFSWDRVVCWLLLVLVFVIKIRIEEKELRIKFPEYAEYEKETNRLIPFVW